MAHAQDACEAAAPMEGQRLLRRLSLDLRGRVPGREDIAAQAGKTAVDARTIDGWLRSPEIVSVMRRRRRRCGGALRPSAKLDSDRAGARKAESSDARHGAGAGPCVEADRGCCLTTREDRQSRAAPAQVDRRRTFVRGERERLREPSGAGVAGDSRGAARLRPPRRVLSASRASS